MLNNTIFLECLSSTLFGSPVSSTITYSKRKSPKISVSCRQKQKLLRLMEERFVIKKLYLFE